MKKSNILFAIGVCIFAAVIVVAVRGSRLEFELAKRTNNLRWMCDFVQRNNDKSIKLIQDALPRSDPSGRLLLAMTTSCYRGETTKIIPVLRTLLMDRDRYVRAQAVQRTAQFGPRCVDLLPDLIRMIDSDDEVAYDILTILYRFESDAKAAIPALKRLEERNPNSKEYVHEAMRGLSKFANE